jgi:hypothetical protein
VLTLKLAARGDVFRVIKYSDEVIHLANTRKYIQDFTGIARKWKNSDELYTAMLKPYPDRYNTMVLYWGAVEAYESLFQIREGLKLIFTFRLCDLNHHYRNYSGSSLYLVYLVA